MTTQTLQPSGLRSTTAGAPSPRGLLGHLRAIAARWRSRNGAQDPYRDLASLSAHVLRDIGARDSADVRSDAFARAHTSMLDFEIRG